MNQNKESGTIYFIAGLLFGGLIGAFVGMLVAPEDGQKTRAELKKSSEKILKNSMSALETFEKKQLTPSLNKLADSVQKSVNEAKKEGLEKTVNKVIRKIQPTETKTKS